MVEVKTTDTYRINLDTVAEYRTQLIAVGKLDRAKSSILIVVGRQDTGDLEAQIRGSQHAWDVRLISVEALLRLAEVKVQLNNWSTSNKINQLLRPVEYTRLDGIVELLFATKQDLETPEIPVPPGLEEKGSTVKSITPSDVEMAREDAVHRVEAKLGVTFVRRGRALRASSDGNTRLVCLASQRYQGPGGSDNYWFGVTRTHCDFLQDAAAGYLSLVCADTGKSYLVPREDLFGWLPKLLTTPSDPVSPEDIRHWHVYFNDYGNHVDVVQAGGGPIPNLRKFML